MESSPVEYQPCPLQFYDFRQLDHRQHCPLFSAFLDNPDGGIAVEDVETLESEMMALQHNVQNRINLLESELAVLDSWQVKREYRKRKHSDTSESLPQRSQPVEAQLSKKPRLESKKVKSLSKKSKSQSTESTSALSEDNTPSIDHALLKQKGDVLDRFWASIEPYCADITDNELTMLQDGMKSYDSGDDPYCIPQLGVHYSKRWAIEDLHSEQSESSRLGQLTDPLSSSSKGKKGWKEEGESILKSAESQQQTSDDRFQYGPLTERLIAAFLEDPSAGKTSSTKPHGHRIDPPINLPQVQALETRIRNELITLGLFDPEDDAKSENGADKSEEGEDEIMGELMRKQAELKAVVEYNVEQRKTLLALAKVEMRRQELRQQAKEADEEVMEWLVRITANKQKRKGISRKEKEAAWRALEQRDTIQAKMMA